MPPAKLHLRHDLYLVHRSQKRKLEEMYEALRGQYEKLKRSTAVSVKTDRSKFNLATPGL